MATYIGSRQIAPGRSTVVANPSGDTTGSLETIEVNGTKYEVSDSQNPFGEDTVTTNKFTFGGTHSSVVHDGATERMRVYMSSSASGADDDMRIIYKNSTCGMFADLDAGDNVCAGPPGVLNTQSGLNMLGIHPAYFDNISSQVNIALNNTITIHSGSGNKDDSYNDVMSAIDGLEYTIDGTTYTISADTENGEITFPGLSATSNGHQFVLFNSNNDEETFSFGTQGASVDDQDPDGNISQYQLGGRQSRVVIDIDTADSIHSEDVSLNATFNETSTSLLNRLGAAIAAVDTDITWDEEVHDGTFTNGGNTFNGKYIEIDFNVESVINHSITFTQGEGTNWHGIVEDLDHIDSNQTASTYTVTDPGGTESTSFTSSVSSYENPESDLEDVLGNIVDAINDNEETPLNWHAHFDSTSKVLTIGSEPGTTDSSWSITIAHGTHADPMNTGNITVSSVTTATNDIVKSEAGDKYFWYNLDDLPSEDPHIRGVLYRDGGDLRISTGE